MNVMKKLEQRLLETPQERESQILGNLVKALCMGGDFLLADLYELGHDDFELALKVLKNWRTSRYTKTRDRLKEMVDGPEEMVENPAD